MKRKSLFACQKGILAAALALSMISGFAPVQASQITETSSQITSSAGLNAMLSLPAGSTSLKEDSVLDEAHMTIEEGTAYGINLNGYNLTVKDANLIVNGQLVLINRSDKPSKVILENSQIVVGENGSLKLDTVVFDGGSADWAADEENARPNGSSYVAIPPKNLPDTFRGNALIVSQGELLMENCIVQNNISTVQAQGAVTSTGGTVTINNCLFDHNLGARGAALHTEKASTVSITNTTFQNNFAIDLNGVLTKDKVWYGQGAVWMYGHESAVVDNCIFNNNSSSSGDEGGGQGFGNGGAIYADGSKDDPMVSLSITNSKFYENLSGNDGTAISLIHWIYDTDIENCTFIENKWAGAYSSVENVDNAMAGCMGTIWIETADMSFADITGATTVKNCLFERNESSVSGISDYGYPVLLTVENTQFLNGIGIDTCLHQGPVEGSTYKNCLFKGNDDSYATVQIWNTSNVWHPNLIMEDCELSNNQTYYYGALATIPYKAYTGGTLDLVETTVTNNTGGRYGAGMFIRGSYEVTVDEKSIIANNIAHNEEIGEADDISIRVTDSFEPVLHLSAFPTDTNTIVEDCEGQTHLVDGWYLDNVGDRWSDDNPTALVRMKDTKAKEAAQSEAAIAAQADTEATQEMDVAEDEAEYDDLGRRVIRTDYSIKAAHGTEPQDDPDPDPGKHSYPGMDKKVNGKDNDSVLNEDTITYTLKSNLPDTLMDYVYDENNEYIKDGKYILTFHDVMDDVIKLDTGSISVEIAGHKIAKTDYKILLKDTANAPEDDCTMEVVLDLVALYKKEYFSKSDVKYARSITVTYTAKLPEGTEPGTYENNAWVEYEEGKSEPDPADVYNFGLKIYKYDSKDEAIPLAGAEFNIFDENGNVAAYGITDSEGNLIIKNLKEGTYTIKEIKAPKGYALISQTQEIILNKEKTGEDYYFEVKIANTEVPDTGSDQTKWIMIAAAGLLAASAYFFFSGKREENA